MSTKQVKMEFQVVADNGVSANVTVTVDGVQKFSGALAQTVEVLVPADIHYDTVPNSLVTFDLDVANAVIPPAPPYNTNDWTTTTNFTVLVTGGDVILQEIEANYSPGVITIAPPFSQELVPGNATDFVTASIGSQPTWDGVEILDYYDFPENTGTGNGNLPIPNGTTMACQINMPMYNNG